MIKQTYETVRKEHPLLPEFDKINKEFELETIEQEQFFLRQIKRKIAEKLEIALALLEKIINPDTASLADIYECRVFTNGEKKQIMEHYRHLMEHYRALFETDLIGDDATDAETIFKLYDTWMKTKPHIIPVLKKMRESWQKQIEPEQILEYLGWTSSSLGRPPQVKEHKHS